MSFKLEEFNPAKPVLVLDSKGFELSLITLQKEVQIKEKHGSLNDVFGNLKETLFQVIWILLEDKKHFNNSFKNFENFILSNTNNDSLVETAKKTSEVFNEVVYKSMPLIKNAKRHKEISQIKNQNKESQICYVSYFDTVSKRYSYTIEEFYNLTLRQLHMLLEQIGDATYEELEIQAALQGKKLKPRVKFDDVSEEQEKENEQEAMDALKRLQEKYKNNQKES